MEPTAEGSINAAQSSLRASQYIILIRPPTLPIWCLSQARGPPRFRITSMTPAIKWKQGGVTPQSSVIPPATAVKHKVRGQEAKIVKVN